MVTTPLVSDAGKQRGGGEVPTIVLSETRGLIAFSGCPKGHRVFSRDWQCSKHILRRNGIMDTHLRTRASEEPKAITGNESCEEKAL